MQFIFEKSSIFEIFPGFCAEIRYFRRFIGNLCQFFQKNADGPVQRKRNQFSAANQFEPHCFNYEDFNKKITN